MTNTMESAILLCLHALSTLFTTKLQTATTTNHQHTATQPNPPISHNEDISTFRIGMNRQQSPFTIQRSDPV